MEINREKAKYLQSFGGETWEKCGHLEDLEVTERVQLKWLLHM